MLIYKNIKFYNNTDLRFGSAFEIKLNKLKIV